MLTRRQFCRTAGAAVAVALPGITRRAAGAAAEFEVTPLGPDAWLIAGEGGNSLLFTSTEGPVLVDTKVGPAGPGLLREVTALAGRPPALLINTHHHADHTGGNWSFAAKTEIVAHVNVRPRLAATIDEKIRPALLDRAKALVEAGNIARAQALRRRAGALKIEAFAADREVNDGESRIRFGGREIVLLHVAPAHTDNDLAVFLPDLDIIHAGDLLFHRLHPFVDRAARANTRGWQRSLLAVSRLCHDRTTVIPGHGEKTDRIGLDLQHVYFQRLREIVATEMAAGRTRAEVTALTPAVFEELGFPGLRSRTLGAMYDELQEEGKGSD